jgi:hypothetical protein
LPLICATAGPRWHPHKQLTITITNTSVRAGEHSLTSR